MYGKNVGTKNIIEGVISDMKACEMKPGFVYRAITSSSDGSIEKGEWMWISPGNLSLNMSLGWLDKEEWMSKDTCDFEVEEDVKHYVYKDRYVEQVRTRSQISQKIRKHILGLDAEIDRCTKLVEDKFAELGTEAAKDEYSDSREYAALESRIKTLVEVKGELENWLEEDES